MTTKKSKPKKVDKAQMTLVESHVVTDQSIARRAATAILTDLDVTMRTSELMIALNKVTKIVEDAIADHDHLQPKTNEVEN